MGTYTKRKTYDYTELNKEGLEINSIIAIAEVDEQDTHQLIVIGFACVSNEYIMQMKWWKGYKIY